MRYSRHFIPSVTIECSAGRFFVDAAPLLEEEGDVLCEAAVADLGDPVCFHRPGAGAGLAADDHPVDAGEV